MTSGRNRRHAGRPACRRCSDATRPEGYHYNAQISREFAFNPVTTRVKNIGANPRGSGDRHSIAWQSAG